VGGAFSIADISIATQFVNLAHAGYVPDAQKWSNLSRYLKAIHARPSFAACIAEERAVLSKFGF
jgi:glutathione S-transferase